MLKIKKQLSKLYWSSILGNLSLSGAWVAILAARGYSLVEIGIAETVFHITSLMFELPSGALADMFGRKKCLIASSIMHMIGNVIMILSTSLSMVCLSIAFQALCYNFSSGSGEALAYDSLKLSKQTSEFERYISNQLMIYRICSGISTLCAGFALILGYKIAYGVDLIVIAIQIMILLTLQEVTLDCLEQTKARNKDSLHAEFIRYVKDSFQFVIKEKKVMIFMFANSFVGAIDILLLFFLQAKLPECGIPAWGVGPALFFMELGGLVGAKLILKLPKIRYHKIFFLTSLLVISGVFIEHSGIYLGMMIGGFIAAMGDDALQVRTNAILQDMFPSDKRATLTSIESFTFSVIMIVLSPLAGIVFTYW
ncbi:MAG: MFS transporter [Acetatifactor sp.]|nr:MFS transporter [Acetatifactor sp.]